VTQKPNRYPGRAQARPRGQLTTTSEEIRLGSWNQKYHGNGYMIILDYRYSRLYYVIKLLGYLSWYWKVIILYYIG
jgi:hypothetical protein